MPEFRAGIGMSSRALPNNVVLKIILADDLIEHNLDVVACMPVAVIVKAARLLEHARHLNTARSHELDISLGRSVSVLKGAPFLGLTPKDFVISIRVEWRIDVDQGNARIGQLP